MAFSLRKMFSNITYFKKTGHSPESPSDQNFKQRRNIYEADESTVLDFEAMEPDSTSRQCNSLNLPESIKNFAAKKGSLSDTDLLTLSAETPIRENRKKCKKLKLNIKKASQSMNQLSYEENFNVENTPKHILLECKSSDVFSEKFKNFDFNKSFDLVDTLSENFSSSPFEEKIEIDSLSENSDSDQSSLSPIKMCRKVSETVSCEGGENQLVPSASLESFADVELDKNEEERLKILLNYEIKLEQMEGFLRKLLKEFQFHVEVSKIFHSKTAVTPLPGTAISKKQKNSDVMYNNTNKNVRGPSPAGSWNVIVEKEDVQMKSKVKKQLLSLKSCIEDFIQFYLHNYSDNSSSNIAIKKCQRYVPKRQSLSHKKKIKHFDFPDLREAMINLFTLDRGETKEAGTSLSDSDESDMSKCICKCHQHSSQSSESDLGLALKADDRSTSITSSIGNFSLDSSTLTAYSESLEQIVSYNSFQDTSLYNTLLQKAAIERITFYVQVHSIELKSVPADHEFEAKNIITFHCPQCKDTQFEENGLLRHILSQTHCEKIHFLYKTAYIKKCVAAGKEILPSTILNPMKMYRDENKIVCFGDALYACSLCFENLIVGESVLMAHCCDREHVDKREKLAEIIG